MRFHQPLIETVPQQSGGSGELCLTEAVRPRAAAIKRPLIWGLPLIMSFPTNARGEKRAARASFLASKIDAPPHRNNDVRHYGNILLSAPDDQTDCARPTAPKTAGKTACWSHDRSRRLMRQMKTHLVVGGTAKISTFNVRNAASVTLPIKRLTRAERPFVPITNRSGRISETAREMSSIASPSSTRRDGRPGRRARVSEKNPTISFNTSCLSLAT